MFESLTKRLGAAFAGVGGGAQLTEEGIEQGLRDVRAALLEADVHFQVARDFCERVKARALGAERLKGVAAADQFVHACHRELVELMGPEDPRLEFAKSGPTVILMAGLQGAGKTTTAAKLAKLLKDKHHRRPLLVAADVKRPAAVEQLRILGGRIGVPVHEPAPGQSAPEVCAEGLRAAGRGAHDVVILDTAGRLHVDEELMAEVGAIAARTRPHDQILVVDAMTGQDAVRSAEAFHRRLALTGVILTKLDGDARGGAALSIKAVVQRPILFAGVGEKLEDLDAFSPERMAGRILGMGDVVGLVETAAEKIDEEEARATYENMVLGRFTLEDMLAQLRMIKRLGPMKKVLGMIPGMSQLGDLDLADDKRMVHMEALFTSMTPRERLHPELIDMSRRRRIARGAGQDPNAVGELLKSHKAMQRMMKEMNKLGLGARLGAKAKKETLRGLSPTGELAGDGGGGFGGLGLGGLFGGGGSGGLGGLDLGGLGGARPGAGGLPQRPPRPMGSSATRQSAAKRKEKEREKRKKQKKGRRRK